MSRILDLQGLAADDDKDSETPEHVCISVLSLILT